VSDHKRAIVPLEAWAFGSPDTKLAGSSIDLGLLAEALIYYDSVAVQPTNQPQFAALLSWFVKNNAFDDLRVLLQERALTIYEYSFWTTVMKQPNNTYSLWNVQDALQSRPDTFEQRYLYHSSVEEVLPKQRHRVALYHACRDRVIEAKADDFGNPIEHSKEEYADPQRHSLVLQSFVDELYRIKRLGRPPKIEASVVSDAAGHHVDWGVSLDELTRIAGPELNFHPGTPLIAVAHTNRLLWSAAQLSSDLYLPQPMAEVVGDKLYEATERIAKAGNIIEDLKEEVEFPDVRQLVDDGKLGVKEVLELRRKAGKFRTWLQQESERDRNAIIAYHNEIAKESGFATGARKALSVFGVLGGSVAGVLATKSAGGVAMGALAGAGARSGLKYLTDLVGHMGANWKPVVFGGWMRTRIEKHMRALEQKTNSEG
jgi:hypothetical protein